MRSKEALAYSRSTGYFCSRCSFNRPSKRIIQAPRPAKAGEGGPGLATTHAGGAGRVRHNGTTQLLFGARRCIERQRKPRVGAGAVKESLMRTSRDQGALDALRYYPKAHIRQGT